MEEKGNEIVFNNDSSDEKTFLNLYNQHWEKLFVYAYRILQDESACKDIVQDIFLNIWNRKNDIRILNPDAYLCQSVKFHIAKYIRDHKKNFPFTYIPEHYSNDTEIKINQKELSLHLKNAIDILPNKCRKVFILSRMEGLFHSEIANYMNISVSTVENHINKALKILRKELGEPYKLLSVILIFTF